jgi:hypothetical protein
VTDDPTSNPPKPMSREQQMLLTEFQTLELDFVALCNKIGKSRELSLAITDMEQASMWAVRHLLNSAK